MVLMRLREYWEMENLDFSNFTEININSLGTFLQGLAQDELKKLPEKILLTVIRRLGEQTGLPEDKLKARAYLAVELFKVTLDSFSNHAYFSALGNWAEFTSQRLLRLLLGTGKTIVE